MGRHQELKSPDAFTQIRPHHRSLARAHVSGMAPTQLALAFGFTESHISRILKTPLFMAEIARLERNADENACDMREDLKVMRARSLEVLDEDLHIDPTELQARAIRNKTAQDMLDRTGIRKGQDKPIAPPGSTFNLQQTIVNIEQMSEKEIRDDVMTLIEGDVEDEE